MRPSDISLSSASLQTCRRKGSKQDMIMVPGVSSTIISTPVRRSSARILRPSLPIILPFISSEGILTVVVVTSDTAEEAHLCITVAKSALALLSNSCAPSFSIFLIVAGNFLKRRDLLAFYVLHFLADRFYFFRFES